MNPHQWEEEVEMSFEWFLLAEGENGSIKAWFSILGFITKHELEAQSFIRLYVSLFMHI